MRRRDFVRTAALGTAAIGLGACGSQDDEPPVRWRPEAFQPQDRARVALLRAEAYSDRLGETVLRGIREASPGLDVRGGRVVLKPNLVDQDRHGHIDTHWTVVAAAVEAFRELGAREVIIAEGTSHNRDIERLLRVTGLAGVLTGLDVPFVDLNIDRVRGVPTRSSYTSLERLWVPETVLGADLLVSMAKLKLHHWAGITVSLKNLFGIMPGQVYGWPKNTLHQVGIPNTILDINAALDRPRFAIVDGILGMEGDGPLMGTPVESHLLLFGEDLVAVDATAARLMTVEPERVAYLAEAGRFLGVLPADRIEVVGEDPEELRRDYRTIPLWESIKPASIVRSPAPREVDRATG